MQKIKYLVLTLICFLLGSNYISAMMPIHTDNNAREYVRNFLNKTREFGQEYLDVEVAGAIAGGILGGSLVINRVIYAIKTKQLDRKIEALLIEKPELINLEKTMRGSGPGRYLFFCSSKRWNDLRHNIFNSAVVLKQENKWIRFLKALKCLEEDGWLCPISYSSFKKEVDQIRLQCCDRINVDNFIRQKRSLLAFNKIDKKLQSEIKKNDRLKRHFFNYICILSSKKIDEQTQLTSFNYLERIIKSLGICKDVENALIIDAQKIALEAKDEEFVFKLKGQYTEDEEICEEQEDLYEDDI